MGTARRSGTAVRSTFTLPVLGIALGAVNTAWDHGFGPGAEYASMALGEGRGWLCAGLLACWPGRTWRSAATRALALLVPAVVAYAALDHVLLTPPEHLYLSGLGGTVSDIALWSVGSTVASAGLAGLVVLIRRGVDLAVLAAAVLPAFIAHTARDAHERAVPGDPALYQVTGVIWPLAALVTTTVLVVGFLRLAVRDRATTRPPPPELPHDPAR